MEGKGIYRRRYESLGSKPQPMNKIIPTLLVAALATTAVIASGEFNSKITTSEAKAVETVQAEEPAPSPTAEPTPEATPTATPVATPTVAKKATAKTYSTDCEKYRPLIAKYDWPVDAAMIVMKNESGCNPNAVGPTDDHGLFQINKEKIYDPAKNIARAYEKYVGGRVGSRNWSAWYAVCTRGNNPQPKFEGIKCQ